MNTSPNNDFLPESDYLSSTPEHFDWPRCPEADQILKELTQSILQYHQFAGNLAQRMERETSTRFFDWIDHVRLPPDHVAIASLKHHGFVEEKNIEKENGTTILAHPYAVFPKIIIDPKTPVASCAVGVESVEDFLRVRGILDTNTIDGERGSSLRQTHIDEGTNRFTILERHGYCGFIPQQKSDPDVFSACAQIWQERRQKFSLDPTDDQSLLQDTHDLARLIARHVGQDRAADIVLACERDFWMSRNAAGRLQKERLDRLGLGWGKIRDHHTFRSSRENYLGLIQIFLALGFKKRERFYAGDAHGWGGQVMEHPVTGDVLFLDVDLFPDEAAIDFSIQPLHARSQYRTIGRWCALHGDSILHAGMHHLEAQFNFATLKTDLAAKGIGTMDKFTDFPELQQAFTFGEKWPVHPDRIISALQKGAIDETTAKRIHTEGYAIGSHLENLERNHGYKGFNKSGIDTILRAVDLQRVTTEQEIATTLIKNS